MEKTRKPLMVVGIDESEHSFYALEYTLTNFFPPEKPHHFQLIIVHAKPSPSSVVEINESVSTEFVSILGEDLESAADRTIQRVKEICSRKSVNVRTQKGVENVITQVLEGDARSVLCEAAEKYGATVLVVGCHGYGAIKRAVLGSVSDYCVQHAHCPVMVVKRPKIKRTSLSS